MKKVLKSLLIFIISFLFFNVEKVNTIDDIVLLHDSEEYDEEKYYTISFYDFDVIELDEVFKDLNIKILSVKPINNEKIYSDNTNRLIEEYNKEKYLVNAHESFKIESMVIICTQSELIKLQSRIKII